MVCFFLIALVPYQFGFESGVPDYIAGWYILGKGFLDMVAGFAIVAVFLFLLLYAMIIILPSMVCSIVSFSRKTALWYRIFYGLSTFINVIGLSFIGSIHETGETSGYLPFCILGIILHMVLFILCFTVKVKPDGDINRY